MSDISSRLEAAINTAAVAAAPVASDGSRRRWATIVAVNGGPPPSVTVQFEPDGAEYGPFRYLDTGVALHVTDRVFLENVGGDTIVFGKLFAIAPISSVGAGFGDALGVAYGPTLSVSAHAGNATGSGTANNPSITKTSRRTQVLADSPLLYWQVDDTSGTTAADDSGNGRTGTYTGGFTLSQASLIPTEPSGKSVALNGTTGYITSGYAPFSGQKTFRGVAKRPDHATAMALMGSTGGNVMLRVATNGDVHWFTDTATSSVNWVGAWPGDNLVAEWVLEHDETAHKSRLYINKVDLGELTGVDPYAGSPGNVMIGARGGPSDFWHGNVDAFDICSGLLSATRVAAVYDAGQ